MKIAIGRPNSSILKEFFPIKKVESVSDSNLNGEGSQGKANFFQKAISVFQSDNVSFVEPPNAVDAIDSDQFMQRVAANMKKMGADPKAIKALSPVERMEEVQVTKNAYGDLDLDAIEKLMKENRGAKGLIFEAVA